MVYRTIRLLRPSSSKPETTPPLPPFERKSGMVGWQKICPKCQHWLDNPATTSRVCLYSQQDLVLAHARRENADLHALSFSKGIIEACRSHAIRIRPYTISQSPVTTSPNISTNKHCSAHCSVCRDPCFVYEQNYPFIRYVKFSFLVFFRVLRGSRRTSRVGSVRVESIDPHEKIEVC